MADKRKTILIFGDSPTAHTGFGNVVRELGFRLKDKYRLFFLGINHNGDPLPETKIFDIFPCNRDPFGKDQLMRVLMITKPDLFLTVNDYDALTWVPQYLVKARQDMNTTIPWMFYFPVDGSPFYPKYVNFFKDWVDHPITTTKWGADVIRKTDPSMDIPYIYHGVDTKSFCPYPEEKMMKERAESNMADKFIVLMVGVNQIRKQYGTALQIFAEFAKDKEDVLMVMHTQKNLTQGWDLPMVIHHLHNKYEEKGELGIGNRIAYTNGISGYLGIPREQMPTIFNLSDVFLHTANGEGFGLPIVEAAACGKPIIAQKATVMPELLGDAALWCKTADTMYFPFADRALERPLISKKDAVKHLNKLYENRELCKTYGEKARKKVLYNNDFNWDVVADKFLDQIEKALEDKREVQLDVQEVL